MILFTLFLLSSIMFFSFFFFNDTATTEIYTLSLHDALPISGVAWALVAHAVSRALGGQDLVQALVLGAAVFGMVLQAQFLPLLSYTAGALAGAGVAMGLRAATVEGGVRVAIALALGAALGFVAERIQRALPPGRG